MDLEKSSLELMLGLMSVDDKQRSGSSSVSSKDYESMKGKIKRIIESVRNSNVKGAKNWQVDNISVSAHCCLISDNDCGLIIVTTPAISCIILW